MSTDALLGLEDDDGNGALGDRCALGLLGYDVLAVEALVFDHLVAEELGKRLAVDIGVDFCSP